MTDLGCDMGDARTNAPGSDIMGNARSMVASSIMPPWLGLGSDIATPISDNLLVMLHDEGP